MIAKFKLVFLLNLASRYNLEHYTASFLGFPFALVSCSKQLVSGRKQIT